jgi:folate-binding protein YgfZ
MSESWTDSLLGFGAQFVDGRVVAFTDRSEPPWLLPAGGICDLSHYGLIRISGDDAASFLHGQFTNDVAALEDGQSQPNGWCSPKGRLLATFCLWRTGSTYFLMLPRALQPAIQKRLGMFVLRAKVVIEDASGTTVRIGLLTPLADAVNAALKSLLPPLGRVVDIDGSTLVSVGPSRAVMLTSSAGASAVWQRLAATNAIYAANAWDLGSINDGMIEVAPETQDSFVPQMANFELVGGVSFKKGCYPGQEIVARTQYRGILKRRMAKVRTELAEPLTAGASVYSPAFPDQAAGMVALSALSGPGSCLSLVVAQLESIEHDSLYTDPTFAPSSRLVVERLPYDYPPKG